MESLGIALGTVIVAGLIGLKIWMKTNLSNSFWESFWEPPREHPPIPKLGQLEEMQELLISTVARRGSTISTNQILTYVEDLKETYVNSRKQEEARKIEQIIREFREHNGPEIPIHKVYALMKEVEDKIANV